MVNEFGWLRDRARRMMVGLHVPDYDQAPAYDALVKNGEAPPILEKIDPKSVARELREANIQVFYFYSKCHYGNAYYPSKVGHVHSALNGRDLFGEFCEACLSEGVTPMAVYEFSDMRIPKDRPDWCHRVPTINKNIDMTDANEGTKIAGACLHGPYGDFAIEQAVEVAKNYPIKGYYVDFLGRFNFGNWICPYCQEKFKAAFGYEFRGVDDMTPKQFRDYTRWHYEINDLYARKMRKAFKEHRPDAVFIHNYHGNSHGVNLQRAPFATENGDFVTGDLFQTRSGQASLSWKLRQYSALTRQGLPGEALLDSIVCYAGDFNTAKAKDSYAAELWTARSIDVATCGSTVVQIDGTFNQDVFALCGEIYREQIPYEPWLKDMERTAAVGLVHSHDTLEFQPENLPGNKPVGTVDFPAHYLEIEGWAQTLVAAGQTWDMVQEHRLTPEYLKRFSALVLPAVGCLDADAVNAIRAFVKNGGVLIASGQTSLFDRDGNKQDNFQLADVFGCDYRGDYNLEHCQLKVDRSLFTASRPWVSDILALSQGQLSIALRPGAEALGEIVKKPAINLVNIQAPTGKPGIARNVYGKGVCYYFASDIAKHFRCFGQDNIRNVLTGILRREVSPRAAATVENADIVEIFTHRQTGKNHLVVNLVNYPPGTTQSAGWPTYQAPTAKQRAPIRHYEYSEVPVLAEVVVRLNAPAGGSVKKVSPAPSGETLPLTQKDGATFVSVKNLGVHAALIVEYA